MNFKIIKYFIINKLNKKYFFFLFSDYRKKYKFLFQQIETLNKINIKLKKLKKLLEQIQEER
jgi:recombinational DNA repair protein RecR